MEGGIDSSHVSFLHRGDLESDPLFKGAKGNQYNLGDMRPVFEVVESAGGLYIGARRNAENGNYYWRITPWVMPCFTDDPAARRPSDARPFLGADRRRELLGLELRLPPDPRADATTSATPWSDGKGIHVQVHARAPIVPLANKDNDYLMDRAAQKAGTTYSGVEGIAMQDASLQESMGPICDRTKENLVSTDNGIIMARHRLLRAAKALAGQGHDAARRRSRASPGALGLDRAAAGPGRSRTAPRKR